MKKIEHERLELDGVLASTLVRASLRGGSRRASRGRSSLRLIGAACGLGAPDARCAEAPARVRTRLASSPNLRGRFVWQRMVVASATLNREGFPPRGLGPFCRRLAKAVDDCVADDARFIVLGGDHSCAIGTWNGARAGSRGKGPLGLIWIDAHMDSHTSLTSQSGRAHGMPQGTAIWI